MHENSSYIYQFENLLEIPIWSSSEIFSINIYNKGEHCIAALLGVKSKSSLNIVGFAKRTKNISHLSKRWVNCSYFVFPVNAIV
mgnify:FL=1